jgi:GntR family transcriptional regulator
MNRAPVVRIDPVSPRPVYEQIVSGIRALLVAGDQLPTVRRLAINLGVHHNTVAESYRVLAEEGWLDLRRGRGVLVVDRREPKPTPEAKQGFSKRLEDLIAEAIADGVPRSAIAARMADLTEKLAVAERARQRTS